QFLPFSFLSFLLLLFPDSFHQPCVSFLSSPGTICSFISQPRCLRSVMGRVFDVDACGSVFSVSRPRRTDGKQICLAWRQIQEMVCRSIHGVQSSSRSVGDH
ncbi:hypothetical protein Tsubulata_026066, partial [Turnera subulata]